MSMKFVGEADYKIISSRTLVGLLGGSFLSHCVVPLESLYNPQHEHGNAGLSSASRGGTVMLIEIIVGIIGAVLAGWLLPLAGFVLVGGIVAEIINAVIGAVILLVVVGFFKKD